MPRYVQRIWGFFERLLSLSSHKSFAIRWVAESDRIRRLSNGIDGVNLMSMLFESCPFVKFTMLLKELLQISAPVGRASTETSGGSHGGRWFQQVLVFDAKIVRGLVVK